ncbi:MULTISPECIES: hypothetical protein [unclassified Microcoleus]|uniref:hypothetical protein n=1 Tax=unclassified Microcoleus TaxID=2642155 RepID=UPI002FD6954E
MRIQNFHKSPINGQRQEYLYKPKDITTTIALNPQDLESREMGRGEDGESGRWGEWLKFGNKLK